MDIKRIGYLLIWALVLGLGLVHLRTSRMQSVYQISCLKEQQRQMQQTIWQQQAQLSELMESPRRIKKLVAALGLSVCPPDEEQPGAPEGSRRWVQTEQ